jgi:hypothetical protein
LGILRRRGAARFVG